MVFILDFYDFLFDYFKWNHEAKKQKINCFCELFIYLNTFFFMEYLDFEIPLKELEEQLNECRLIGDKSEVDVSETCEKLLKKIESTKKKFIKILLHGKEFSFLDTHLDLIL